MNHKEEKNDKKKLKMVDQYYFKKLPGNKLKARWHNAYMVASYGGRDVYWLKRGKLKISAEPNSCET